MAQIGRPLNISYKNNKWLYRNCRGICNDPGPRPSLRKGRRLGLGPTIEQTTGIPVEPTFSTSFIVSPDASEPRPSGSGIPLANARGSDRSGETMTEAQKRPYILVL